MTGNLQTACLSQTEIFISIIVISIEDLSSISCAAHKVFSLSHTDVSEALWPLS